MGNYPFTPGGGGGGSVVSVTAGDASITVGGTATNPTIETGTLDQIANLHPAAANWSNNSHKITSLANGTAAQDAVAFGQIPAALGTIGSDGQVLAVNSSGVPAWLNTPVSWINIVTTYGADPTGTADSTTAWQSAVTAAIGSGRPVYAPAGTYKIAGNVTAVLTTFPLWIICDPGATVINFTGSGDCFRIYCPTLFTGGNFLIPTCVGGGITGAIFDGSSHTGTGASAVHFGDIFRFTTDVEIRNWTASGDIPVHADNTWFWTEEMRMSVVSLNCVSSDGTAVPVVFDQTPNVSSTDCTGSFDGADISIYTVAGTPLANGAAFRNGTYMVSGSLKMNGGYVGSSSSQGTTAVLTLTGLSPSGSLDHSAGPYYSNLREIELDIAVECETGTGSNGPYTIYFGTPSASAGDITAGNLIVDAYGLLAFLANSTDFTFTNGSADTVQFWGVVTGDTINPVINKFAAFNGGIATGDMSFMNGVTSYGATGGAPYNFGNTTMLTAPAAGALEYDGASTYLTNELTSGRGLVPAEQKFRLTATGGTISTIANYFGTNSNISLVSGGEYEIEIDCWFLCTTGGAVTWTFTNSAAPTSMNVAYQFSPATGLVTGANPPTATALFGEQYNLTAAAPTVVSATLTTAVNHHHHFWIRLINGTGTSLKIQATKGTGGTITPGINSSWKARRVPAANVGAFSA